MRSRKSSINTVSFFAFQDIITSVVGIFVLITLIMILELVETKIGSKSSRVTVPAEMIARVEEMEQEVAKLGQLHERLQANANVAAGRNAFTIEEELAALTRQQRDIDSELNVAVTRSEKLKKQLADARQTAKQLQSREKDLANKRDEAKSLATAQQDTAKVGAILEIEKPLIFRDQTEQGRYLVLVLLEKDAIQLTDAQTGKSERFTRGGRERDFQAWLKKIDLKTRQFLLIVKPSGEADFEKVRTALTGQRAIYGFDVAGEDQKFRLRSQLGGV